MRKPQPRKPPADHSRVATDNKYADPTPKQLEYIEGLARSRGYRGAMDARRDFNGRNRIGAMKRDEASQLIDWLKQED